MKRIICIGNRYTLEDAGGPKVYDHLLQCALPNDIEVIDGGLAGLNLLRFMDGAERVVFVDNVSGFGQPNKIVIIEAADMVDLAKNGYDHSSGLAYLLRVLPEVCEGTVPQILLVGIEVVPNDETIDKAASLALKLAVEEGRSDTRFLPGIKEGHNGCAGQ